MIFSSFLVVEFFLLVLFFSCFLIFNEKVTLCVRFYQDTGWMNLWCSSLFTSMQFEFLSHIIIDWIILHSSFSSFPSMVVIYIQYDCAANSTYLIHLHFLLLLPLVHILNSHLEDSHCLLRRIAWFLRKLLGNKKLTFVVVSFEMLWLFVAAA